MAVREYIGARYVPKFAGTFDPTTVYEALTVVDNGVGTSYISIKPVPAGTSLNDTTYWALYGVASGAVLDLQGRMTTAENDIDALEAQALIDEADIKKRRIHNIICIGDSYGTWTPGVNRSWISYLDSMNNGAVYQNNKGGSGFLAAEYDPGEATYKSFLTLLQELAPSITDKNSITDIVVAGGYNDLSAGHPYISDLGTKMAEFKSYCKTTFPNATVYVGMIGRSDVLNTVRLLMEETYPYYVAGARNCGMVYLTGVESVLKSDLDLRADGHHPNDNGAVKLGNAIYNILNGSAPDVFYNVASGVNAPTGYTLSGSPTITYDADLNGITATSNGFFLVPDNAPVSMTYHDTVIDCGTIATPYGHVYDKIYSTVRVLITDNAYHFTTAIGYAYIDDDHVKVSITSIERGTGSWDTISTRQIAIAPFSIYIPAHSC